VVAHNDSTVIFLRLQRWTPDEAKNKLAPDSILDCREAAVQKVLKEEDTEIF